MAWACMRGKLPLDGPLRDLKIPLPIRLAPAQDEVLTPIAYKELSPSQLCAKALFLF